MYLRHSKIRGILLSAAVFAAAIFSLMPVRTVFAAGTINLTSETVSGVAAGDSVTVSYEATAEGDGAEAPQITVEYDPARLEVAGADKEYSGGGGSIVLSELTASITFTVLSGGEATITASAVLGGDAVDVPTSTVTILADGEDTAAAAAAAAAGGPAPVAGEGIPSPDGKLMVSTVFPDEFLPAGFHKETDVYQSTAVECAVFDNGDVRVVYTTDIEGQNGSLRMLDTQTGELKDFRMIEGAGDKYIIILKAPADVEAPEGYTKATLQWNDQNFEAYMKVGDSSEAVVSDFFLVYAVSSSGNIGWYMYDQTEGTYQRFLIDDTQTTKASEESIDAVPLYIWIIIGVLGLLMLIFLVIMIVTLVKLKEYESYEYIDEDEDYTASGSKPAAGPDKEPAVVRSAAPQRKTEDKKAGLKQADAISEGSDEELFDPRKARKELKEKEKAEKKGKKNKGTEDQGGIDWEAMESAMKDTSDTRRPGREDASINHPAGARPAESYPSAQQMPKRPVNPSSYKGKPEGGEGSNPSADPVRKDVNAGHVRREASSASDSAMKTPANAAGAAASTAGAAAEGAESAATAAGAGVAAAAALSKKSAATDTEQRGGMSPAEGRDEVKRTGVRQSEAVKPDMAESEEKRRQELLNAARKPESRVETKYDQKNDQYGSQYSSQYGRDPYYGQYQNTYGAQDGRGGSYMQDYQSSSMNGRQDPYQGVQYSGYDQDPYAQSGYGNYQYDTGYGQYGAGYQYGGQQYQTDQYYQPVPSAPSYNREQFNAGIYNTADLNGEGYGGYDQGVNMNGQYYSGQQIPRESGNTELDDDFEFEFLNMGDN